MTGVVVRLRKRRASDPPLGDEALATAASTGDPTAVAELFDRFHGPVTRYLSRAVGVGPDVEDLLQTTFMEIARGRSHFEGRSTALTWVLGIATNVVRHHRRSMGRLRKLESAARLAVAEPRMEPADVDARRALEIAQRTLDEMPIEKKLAFVLCEIEGLSAREASEILGATEAAVWKRVSQVRRALREAAGRGGEP
jgi:RNA polymerase sigma-70 factor (ECF subfamily)